MASDPSPSDKSHSPLSPAAQPAGSRAACYYLSA